MREASLPPKLVRNAVLTASGRLLGELIGHFVARNARVCRDHMTVTSFCLDTRCVHTSMAALAQFWPGPSPSGRMRWMAACESEKTYTSRLLSVCQQTLVCLCYGLAAGTCRCGEKTVFSHP